MANSQLDKVERAFHAAVAARDAGMPVDLAALCDGDTSVADEVRNLLRHLEEAGPDEIIRTEKTQPMRLFLAPSELHADRQPSRLDGPNAENDADHENEWGISTVGQRVGEFTIVGELGAGGMGVVFVAAQDNPQRTVALKLIRRAIATRTLIRRFEREAQLLGRLNHPGIAQVYAAGVANIVTSDGGTQMRTPYIAMELVEGPTILEHVRKHRADGAQLAIRLIAQVCDAIEHAHLRGVIHRDLKPANILIATDTQGQPRVKVLDFGVARQADEDVPDADAATKLTFHGHLVGTLAYMAPEQFSTLGDADVRCDVYALGAILHQLLSGQHPIDVADCTLLEAARRITEQEPKWLGTIDSSLRGDVETIVAKTLEKEPGRRYQSPAELARDLRNYLSGAPIEARRDSVMYVLRKQAARYRALSAFATLFLIVAIAVVFYAHAQELQQQHIAQIATGAQSEAEAARRRADTTAASLAEELSASRIAEGRWLGESGDLIGAERLLWEELVHQTNKNAPRWALWELYSRSGCANTIAAHEHESHGVATAPDGKTFATCGEDRFVRIWSLADGAKVAEYDSGLSIGRSIAFMHDGSAVIVTGPQGAMKINVATGVRLQVGDSRDAYGLDISPDGSAVLVANNDGTVRLFSCATPAQPVEMLVIKRDDSTSQQRRGARGVCFDHTGTQLAVSYDDGTVKLFKLSRNGNHLLATPGPALGRHTEGSAQCVQFSPSGDVLVSGGTDRVVKLWRVADGTLIASAATSNGTARAIAFNPDGKTFVVPGFWKTQFFDAKTGQPIAPPNDMAALGAGGSYGACFTQDGEHLITAQSDGACRIWRLNGKRFALLPSTNATVRDLAIAKIGDQTILATAQSDGTIRLRQAPVARPMQSEWPDVMRCNVGDQLRSMTMSADASRIIAGFADGRVLTLDARDGRVLQELAAHQGTVSACRLSPDGKLLVTCGNDALARVWRRNADGSGWSAASTLQCDGDVVGATISPNGAILVTTSRPNHVRFWSLRADGTAELIQSFASDRTPWKPAFSRKGDRVAMGSWDRSIMLWDTRALKNDKTATPRHELSLMGHSQLPIAVAFEDSNRLLASVSNDGTLRLWDIARADGETENDPLVDRRRALATLDAHAGDAICVGFLPAIPRTTTLPIKLEVGPSIVAAGYADGNIRLWDLQYFHEAIMHNDLYQRALRGNRRATTSPSSAPAPH